MASTDVKVSKLLVHPIKSCRGISVQRVAYTPRGLENDRKWCIIDAERNVVLTAREVSKMVLITPRIEVDKSSPDGGTLAVSFPDDSGCEPFSVALQPSVKTLEGWKITENLKFYHHEGIDGYICECAPSQTQSPSSILSKFMERPVHLVYKGPRLRMCQPTTDFPQLEADIAYQDGYPLLVISEESSDELEKSIRAQVGVQGVEECWKNDKLAIERFRPNIVFRGAGPFAEDTWETIVINDSDFSSTITLVSKCARCLLPNVSPDTGIRDKAVPYKIMMKTRRVDGQKNMTPYMGCNGVPNGSGDIVVGDRVTVVKLAA